MDNSDFEWIGRTWSAHEAVAHQIRTMEDNLQLLARLRDECIQRLHAIDATEVKLGEALAETRAALAKLEPVEV